MKPRNLRGPKGPTPSFTAFLFRSQLMSRTKQRVSFSNCHHGASPHGGHRNKKPCLSVVSPLPPAPRPPPKPSPTSRHLDTWPQLLRRRHAHPGCHPSPRLEPASRAARMRRPAQAVRPFLNSSASLLMTCAGSRSDGKMAGSSTTPSTNASWCTMIAATSSATCTGPATTTLTRARRYSWSVEESLSKCRNALGAKTRIYPSCWTRGPKKRNSVNSELEQGPRQRHRRPRGPPSPHHECGWINLLVLRPGTTVELLFRPDPRSSGGNNKPTSPPNPATILGLQRGENMTKHPQAGWDMHRRCSVLH